MLPYPSPCTSHLRIQTSPADGRSIRTQKTARTIKSLQEQVGKLEACLRESEENYRHAFELNSQILWTAAPDGSILSVSHRWGMMTGLSEAQTIEAGWAAVTYPDDLESAMRMWQHSLETGCPVDIACRLRMRSGEYRWVRVYGAPRFGPNGSVVRWYGTIEDIHDRKIAEESLNASEILAKRVLASTMDLVFFMDQDWRITYMNAKASQFCKAQMGGIGDNFWDLYADYRGSDYERCYQQALISGEPVRFEVYLAESEVWLDINACPADGGLAVFFNDITETKRARDELFRLTHEDPLTGLANRALFNEVLEQAFASMAGQETSVLLLDLDMFKDVNDTLGHPAGDALLRSVADRLRSVVDEGSVLARLGGDEFAVIHQREPLGTSAEVLAGQLLSCFSEPFPIGGTAITLAASVGIATSSYATTSPEGLFKAADIALYRAKEDGRGMIRLFDRPMAERVLARQSMKADLEAALERNELRLVYQPFLDISSNTIAGAEALLRWHHPTRGYVPPIEFIPLAEETGLIAPIGEWILSTACMQAAEWPDDTTVAVNLSAVQIRDKTLLMRVMSALSRAGLPACRLELEITETVLLHDSEHNIAMLHSLREAGVRIALDDFGTGFSSLSYLRHFPFDKLKLDRCFVGDIGHSPQSEAIVMAAGAMGRALSMTTTAEGVETQVQLEWLRANGWSQAQGFHIARPMECSTIRQTIIGLRDRADLTEAA